MALDLFEQRRLSQNVVVKQIHTLEGNSMIFIPRFKNGNLVPNEELDVYPQTQEIILASLLPKERAREEAETERLKKLDEKDQTKSG